MLSIFGKHEFPTMNTKVTDCRCKREEKGFCSILIRHGGFLVLDIDDPIIRWGLEIQEMHSPSLGTLTGCPPFANAFDYDAVDVELCSCR